MKIRLKKIGIDIIKEFNNKSELFDFTKRELERKGIIENDMERKILNSNDYNRFTIYDLVNEIDYRRI